MAIALGQGEEAMQFVSEEKGGTDARESQSTADHKSEKQEKSRGDPKRPGSSRFALAERFQRLSFSLGLILGLRWLVGRVLIEIFLEARVWVVENRFTRVWAGGRREPLSALVFLERLHEPIGP